MELGTTDQMADDKTKFFLLSVGGNIPQNLPWLDNNFNHGGEKKKEIPRDYDVRLPPWYKI